MAVAVHQAAGHGHGHPHFSWAPETQEGQGRWRDGDGRGQASGEAKTLLGGPIPGMEEQQLLAEQKCSGEQEGGFTSAVPTRN